MQQITKDKNNKAFGLFFILLGVGCIFVNYFLGLRQMQLQKELNQMGSMAIIAQVCYSNFSSLVYSLFVSVTPCLCIFTGALIFSGKRNVKATMITGIIIHTFYILSIILVNYIAYITPKQIVAMYTYSEVEQVASLLKTVILPKQILPAILYMLYSSAFFVVSTIFLAGKRYKNNNQNAKTAGVVGVILMLIAFAVISMIKTPMNNILIGSVFGHNMLAAKGSADGMFITSFIYPILLSFIIVAPLLFEKMKRKKLILITIGAIITMGLVDLIFSGKTMVSLYGVPDEIYSETLTFLIQKIFLNTIRLISLALWFDSAERNTAPLWLQISLPLAVPILWYIFIGFIEIPLIYSSQSVYFLDLALVHNYILIIVLSLTVKYRRKSNFISQ